MTLRSIVIAILATGIAVNAPAAEIYKYTAPDGSVVFTDKRPNESAQVVTVPPARTLDAAERRKEEERQRVLEGIARRRLEKDGEASASRRADDGSRCQKARQESSYFQLDSATRRLEKDDPRPFYTAAEISQRRAAAKRDMAEFCR